MSITDSRIRGSVWQDEAGRWRVAVYYAARRVPVASPAFRVAADRDYTAEVIGAVYTDRGAALDRAHFLVRLMRGAAALAAAGTAGTVPGEELLGLLAPFADDAQEDDCDA